MRYNLMWLRSSFFIDLLYYKYNVQTNHDYYSNLLIITNDYQIADDLQILQYWPAGQVIRVLLASTYILLASRTSNSSFTGQRVYFTGQQDK